MRKYVTASLIMIFSLFLFLLVLSSESNRQISSPKTTLDDSVTIRIQNVKALAISRFGDRIKFDDDGIPVEIEGDLSKGITAKGAADQSYQFFEINKDIIGIQNPRDVLIVDDVHFEGAIVVKLHLEISRIRIPSNFTLTFTKEGILYRYSGGIDPEARKIDLHPAISEEQAIEITLNDSKAYHTTTENAKSLGLTIGRFDDGILKLTWMINVRKFDSVAFDYNYCIDAKTGKILDMQTRIWD
jgi:Zn-dependent metalloprotease